MGIFFCKPLGDSAAQVGTRAHGLNLWMHGPSCLIGKPTLGFHHCPEPSPHRSGLGRGPVGASERTKRVCPQLPHPRWSLGTWAQCEPEAGAVGKRGLRSHCFPEEHSQEVPTG